jgi:YVTN family beta-propeller protein
VAVNPVTNKIYVGNAGDPYLTVIDGVTNTATAISTPGIDPWVVAVNPVTNKIYAGNYGAPMVAVSGRSHQYDHYGTSGLLVEPSYWSTLFGITPKSIMQVRKSPNTGPWVSLSWGIEGLCVE